MARGHGLWPREHGAYAQLGVPLVTALVLGTGAMAAILMAVGACLAFLAHEPLLVVLGFRGKRMRAELGDRARVRLALGLGGAAIAGVVGLVLAPPDARLAAAALTVPVVAMLAQTWRRALHGVWGELIAAVALPGASTPVAIAGGFPAQHAVVLWAAWSLGYAASVLAVHEVLSKRRRLAIAAALSVATLSVAAGLFATPVVGIALPLVAASAVIAVMRPSPRRLRRIGVVLVGMSGVTAALALAILAPT